MANSEKLSAGEFRQRVSTVSERPLLMFEALNGVDAQIDPWEWLFEASPLANDGDGAYQANRWGHVILYYNAWAQSVGRPPITIDDLARGGASGDVATAACEAIMTFPAPQKIMTAEQLHDTGTVKLQIVLATHVSQIFAAEHLKSVGSLVPGTAAAVAIGGSGLIAAVAAELDSRQG